MDLSLAVLFILTFAKSEGPEISDEGKDLDQNSRNDVIKSEEENKNCNYSKWSEWSKCTQDCIDFENIPTRYRTREIVDDKPVDCSNDDQLGTIEFEVCANLPPCRPGSWIVNDLSDTKILETYDRIRKQMKSIYPEWVITAIKQYPDIINNEIASGIIDPKGDKHSRFSEEKQLKIDDVINDNKQEAKIVKSVKSTTVNQIKCGCPRKSQPIPFGEFIRSNKLIGKLTKLCESNKFNQLVFEGNGRYVYYCNIGMVIKDVESKELTCDSLDSTEYIPCLLTRKRVNDYMLWYVAVMFAFYLLFFG